MNDIFEELGFELTTEGNITRAEQSFENANDLAVTLIDLKGDIIEAGFEVHSESVQGDSVVCAFMNEGGIPITVMQNTVMLSVQILSSVE